MQDPAAPRDVTPAAASPPVASAPAAAPTAATLVRWAGAQPATAPYDFDEFERMARTRGEGRRRTQARLAALAASVSVLLVGTAVWQRAPVGGDPPATGVAATRDTAATAPVLTPMNSAAVAVEAPADRGARGRAPAVVRVHDAALRADLQDRIALLDALLSEARAAGDDDEPLRQVQRSRALLADSLQHVAWADGLSGR
jgi:hypothetical protein